MTEKPAKPSPDFPLFPHATKRWAKKIRGKTVYFGPWADPDGALALYNAQKGALHRGEAPTIDARGPLTVLALTRRFLAFKKEKREAGELSQFTFQDYGEICSVMAGKLGSQTLIADLTPDHFAKLLASMKTTWGPVRVRNAVGRVRTVFRFGIKDQLLEREPAYGIRFMSPTQKEIRKQRDAAPKKLFSAAEIRKLINAAEQPLKAMIMLGINAGFGNSDLGSLPAGSVRLTLARGWIDFPRPKTGVNRRVPLWPETVGAIVDWLGWRSVENGPLFLTEDGRSWAKRKTYSPLSKEFARLAARAGVKGGFYWLRHTFQTVADESRDFIAVRKIMGHVSNDIADAYREQVSFERLQAVTEHVRKWLLAP